MVYVFQNFQAFLKMTLLSVGLLPVEMFQGWHLARLKVPVQPHHLSGQTKELQVENIDFVCESMAFTHHHDHHENILKTVEEVETSGKRRHRENIKVARKKLARKKVDEAATVVVVVVVVVKS